jgi:hypothetical protein
MSLAEDIEETFLQENLSELERRQALQRIKRRTVDIERDLAAQGPLKSYLDSRREEAKEALRILVDIDPNDAVRIVQAQSSVREYLRVVDWIAGHIDDAEVADDELRTNDDHQDGD